MPFMSLYTLFTRQGATLRVGLLPLAFAAVTAFSTSAQAQVVISQVYGGGGNTGEVKSALPPGAVHEVTVAKLLPTPYSITMVCAAVLPPLRHCSPL